MMKKWTQQDIGFWKMKGSKRSKNNAKKPSIRSKIKEKIRTKCLKMVKLSLELNMMETKRFFLLEKGGLNKIESWP